MLQAVLVAVTAGILAIGVSKLVGLGLPFPSKLSAAGVLQLVAISIIVGVLASIAGCGAPSAPIPRSLGGKDARHPDSRPHDGVLERRHRRAALRPLRSRHRNRQPRAAARCERVRQDHPAVDAGVDPHADLGLHPRRRRRGHGPQGRGLAEYRRQTVGVVFQSFNLVPSLTAQENIYVAMRSAGVDRKAAKTRSRSSWRWSVSRTGCITGPASSRAGSSSESPSPAPSRSTHPSSSPTSRPHPRLRAGRRRDPIAARAWRLPDRAVVIATHDERLLPLADRVVELTPRPTNESHRPNGSSSRPVRCSSGRATSATSSTRSTRVASKSCRSCPTAARACSP